MKKTVFAIVAVLVVMAMACNQSGKGGKVSASVQNEVRQSVEKMMLSDVDQILSADLLSLHQQASLVHFYGNYFMGFDWSTGVFDVCSEDADASIEAIKPIDSLHCDVEMRYVDKGCYDEPYTLHLLKEKGQWKIEDVDYTDGSLRDRCKMFNYEVAEWYRTKPAEEIVAYLLEEEPAEEYYSDSNTIYFNNPQAIYALVDELKSCHVLFMQNPGYTEEYGRQIDEMIERVASHY
jgi:hypothetical protein